MERSAFGGVELLVEVAEQGRALLDELGGVGDVEDAEAGDGLVVLRDGAVGADGDSAGGEVELDRAWRGSRSFWPSWLERMR